MDIVTRPSQLASLLLLSLLAVHVDSSFLSQKEPQLINATANTLTFSAGALCPPYCKVLHLQWQLKSWMDSDWTRNSSGAADKNVTFEGLVPGIEYHVRALPLVPMSNSYQTTNVPIAKAYTCSHVVPHPWHFWITERKNNYIIVEWYVPSQLCISAKFLLEKAITKDEDNYLRSSYMCPPPYLADPQPEYTCRANETNGYKQKCTARFEDPEPEEDYYFGVVAVDESGRCSERDYHDTAMLREHSSAISGRVIALIVLGSLMVVFAVVFAVLKLLQRCYR